MFKVQSNIFYALHRHSPQLHGRSQSNLVKYLMDANANFELYDCETSEAAKITSQQFWQRSNQYASAFSTELNIRKGDRLLHCADKSIETFPLYFGVLQLGAIYVPVHHETKDIDHFVNDASPRAIITDENQYKEMRKRFEKKRNVQIVTMQALTDNIRSFSCHSTIECGEDRAIICYTSGTTGKPKGAMITHKNLITNARSLIEQWQMSEKDTLLHALPLNHIHGLCVALNCSLLSGAKIRVMKKFHLQKIATELKKCSMLMGVPTFYTRLLSLPEFNGDNYGHVRLWISGSAPLGDNLRQKFEHKFVTNKHASYIVERYGMSEAQIICANNQAGAKKYPNSVGRPLPGVVVRIDQLTNEIQVSGDNVFAGYWRNDEKTRDTFTQDGWLKTGDCGERNDDGYIYVIGRIKDLIISGGENVAPVDIEIEIDKVSGVIESTVVGVKHDDFGEAVVAIVATNNTEVDQLHQLILRRCEKSLDKHKRPKRIIFTNEIQRNIMGKVQKKYYSDIFNDIFTTDRKEVPFNEIIDGNTYMIY